MSLPTLFGDIMWNLNTIKCLESNQTLMVLGDKLKCETRFIQALFRKMTEDGRVQIVQAISKTCRQTNELLQSYKCSKYLQYKTDTEEELETRNAMLVNIEAFMEKRDGVIRGLQVLSTFERYKSDPSFQIEIEGFISSINNICERCKSIREASFSNARVCP
jgi:hypothetical protein